MATASTTPATRSQKTVKVALVHKLRRNMNEGHTAEEVNDTEMGGGTGAIHTGYAKAYTYSQLDDYLHRGEDPIVRDMSLYIYSMWVYRVERRG